MEPSVSPIQEGDEYRTLRLWYRAIAERWDIKAHVMRSFVDTANSIFSDDAMDPRARVMAGKLIMEADRMNMVRARMAMEASGVMDAKAPTVIVNNQVNVAAIPRLSDAELEEIVRRKNP